MVNVEKLKSRIGECGMNIRDLSEKLGINKSTLYRKLNYCDNTFTIKEAELIATELKLSLEDMNDIFFSNYIA